MRSPSPTVRGDETRSPASPAASRLFSDSDGDDGADGRGQAVAAGGMGLGADADAEDGPDFQRRDEFKKSGTDLKRARLMELLEKKRRIDAEMEAEASSSSKKKSRVFNSGSGSDAVDGSVSKYQSLKKMKKKVRKRKVEAKKPKKSIDVPVPKTDNDGLGSLNKERAEIVVPEGLDYDEAEEFIRKANVERMRREYVDMFGELSDSDSGAENRRNHQENFGSDVDRESGRDTDGDNDSKAVSKPPEKRKPLKPRKASKQAIFDMKRESERLIRMNQMELPVRQGSLSIHKFLAGFGIQRSDNKKIDEAPAENDIVEDVDSAVAPHPVPEEMDLTEVEAGPKIAEPSRTVQSQSAKPPPPIEAVPVPKVDKMVSLREAALIRKENKMAIRKLMASKKAKLGTSNGNDDDDDDDIEIVEVAPSRQIAPAAIGGALPEPLSKSSWAKRLVALAEEQVREKRDRELREEAEAEEMRRNRKKKKSDEDNGADAADDTNGGDIGDLLAEVGLGEDLGDDGGADAWVKKIDDSDDENGSKSDQSESDGELSEDDELVLSDEDEAEEDNNDDTGASTPEYNATPIYTRSPRQGSKMDDASKVPLEDARFAVPSLPSADTVSSSQDISDFFGNSQPQCLEEAPSQVPNLRKPSLLQPQQRQKKKVGILEKMFQKAAERAKCTESSKPKETSIADENDELLGMLSGVFPESAQTEDNPEDSMDCDDGGASDKDEGGNSNPYQRVVDSDDDDDDNADDEGGAALANDNAAEDQATQPVLEEEEGDVKDDIDRTTPPSGIADSADRPKASAPSVAPVVAPQPRPKSKFVETEAHEEEDEFMGLGGKDGEDPEDDGPLVCSGDEDEIEDFKDVIELHRKHLIDDDTKLVDSLINDVTTGALRKRAAKRNNRGGFFTLSDSDDDEELLRKIRKGGYVAPIDEDDPNLAPIDRLAAKKATAAFARCFSSFMEEGESLISDDEEDEKGGVHTVRSVLSKTTAGLSLRRSNSSTLSSLINERSVTTISKSRLNLECGSANSIDGEEGDDEIEVEENEDEDELDDSRPTRKKRNIYGLTVADDESNDNKSSLDTVESSLGCGDDDYEDQMLSSFGSVDVMKLIKVRKTTTVQRNQNDVQSLKYTSRTANKMVNRTFRAPTAPTSLPSERSPNSLRKMKAYALSAATVGGLNTASHVSSSRFNSGRGGGFLVGEAAKARADASVATVQSKENLDTKRPPPVRSQSALLSFLSGSSSFGK